MRSLDVIQPPNCGELDQCPKDRTLHAHSLRLSRQTRIQLGSAPYKHVAWRQEKNGIKGFKVKSVPDKGYKVHQRVVMASGGVNGFDFTKG